MAVLATFSDFKIIKGRKVAQLIFEVPIETADAALSELGGLPRSDGEQWVGVARVDPDAAEKPAEKPKGGPRAQQAGLMCGAPAFWRFLNEEKGLDVTNKSEAAAILRHLCNVTSRADLDHSDDAARAFSEIVSNYRFWLRS
jgi:hypothetical protein